MTTKDICTVAGTAGLTSSSKKGGVVIFLKARKLFPSALLEIEPGRKTVVCLLSYHSRLGRRNSARTYICVLAPELAPLGETNGLVTSGHHTCLFTLRDYRISQFAKVPHMREYEVRAHRLMGEFIIPQLHSA